MAELKTDQSRLSWGSLQRWTQTPTKQTQRQVVITRRKRREHEGSREGRRVGWGRCCYFRNRSGEGLSDQVTSEQAPSGREPHGIWRRALGRGIVRCKGPGVGGACWALGAAGRLVCWSPWGGEDRGTREGIRSRFAPMEGFSVHLLVGRGVIGWALIHILKG